MITKLVWCIVYIIYNCIGCVRGHFTKLSLTFLKCHFLSFLSLSLLTLWNFFYVISTLPTYFTSFCTIFLEYLRKRVVFAHLVSFYWLTSILVGVQIFAFACFTLIGAFVLNGIKFAQFFRHIATSFAIIACCYFILPIW